MIKEKLRSLLWTVFPAGMQRRANEANHRFDMRQLRNAHDYELEAVKRKSAMTIDECKNEAERIYTKITGNQMNWDNPMRFTEKIQWRKIYDVNPIYSELSDKYLVRKWVASKIGEEYLIPLLGVWETAEQIDFSALPQQFVLKTNNGSATNTVVENKDNIDREKIVENYRFWLNYPFGFNSYELHYNHIKPLVIAEKNMLTANMEDLPDYKFFCFDGKVRFSYTMVGYTFNHEKGRLGFFDRDYKLLPFHRMEYLPIDRQLEKPKNYERMVEIAEKLSEGFSHVRVDLYNINGKIYFGEMTFTTSSGNMNFVPDIWDYKLGELWDITKPQVNESLIRG